MTGKQLKAFAARVQDDAIIQCREKSYHTWEKVFSLKAVLEVEMNEQENEGEPAPEPTV